MQKWALMVKEFEAKEELDTVTTDELVGLFVFFFKTAWIGWFVVSINFVCLTQREYEAAKQSINLFDKMEKMTGVEDDSSQISRVVSFCELFI